MHVNKQLVNDEFSFFNQILYLSFLVSSMLSKSHRDCSVECFSGHLVKATTSGPSRPLMFLHLNPVNRVTLSGRCIFLGYHRKYIAFITVLLKAPSINIWNKYVFCSIFTSPTDLNKLFNECIGPIKGMK